MNDPEVIASVVQRMRRGEVRLPFDAKASGALATLQRSQAHMFTVASDVRPADVVDMTAIYNEWAESGKPFQPYEQSVMRPPLNEAMFGMVRRLDDGVTCYVVCASSYEVGDPGFEAMRWTEADRLHGNADHAIGWDEVRWITATAAYQFKFGQGFVVGPYASWKFAIRDDGSIEDLFYVTLPALSEHSIVISNVLAVFCQATTWLNCRNVELVTPQRPRPQARRIARYGVDVREMHVRPVGKTYRSDGTTPTQVGLIPLHTVRGHIAIYGEEGRGKLFGKLSGRYWVPAHARGSAEHGETHPTRVLETS